jgi:hypothetical protein
MKTRQGGWGDFIFGLEVSLTGWFRAQSSAVQYSPPPPNTSIILFLSLEQIYFYSLSLTDFPRENIC